MTIRAAEFAEAAKIIAANSGQANFNLAIKDRDARYGVRIADLYASVGGDIEIDGIPTTIDLLRRNPKIGTVAEFTW